MVFNIGDKVRLKDDHPDSIWVVVMVYEDTGRIGILHSTKDGSQMLWVNPSRLTLVDRHADIKQAIREVLLSKEFLAAFAKAFVNAPMPSTIQPAVLSTQIERSIAQEAFEWFKSEDLAIAPIAGSESEVYYVDKLKKGEAK